eukprot:gene9176-biopygen7676
MRSTVTRPGWKRCPPAAYIGDVHAAGLLHGKDPPSPPIMIIICKSTGNSAKEDAMWVRSSSLPVPMVCLRAHRADVAALHSAPAGRRRPGHWRSTGHRAARTHAVDLYSVFGERIS